MSFLTLPLQLLPAILTTCCGYALTTLGAGPWFRAVLLHLLWLALILPGDL